MAVFREVLPSRRLNRNVCEKYSSYLKTLRSDFVFRCGYCNDPDRFRIRSFTIDHFVPRNPTGWTHTILDNHYYNLVYSCRYCNSAKTNKWPTKDAMLHHDGVMGFIDPCETSYSDLFERKDSGQIVAKDPDNALAAWILDELNLWYPIHERMWKLEKIKTENEQLKLLLSNMEDGPLKENMQKIHYEILQSLEEVQSAIFMENK